MIGATVKWCLGRRQLAHSSASKLHCDYLQVCLRIMITIMMGIMIAIMMMIMKVIATVANTKSENVDAPVHICAAPTLKSSWEGVLQVSVNKYFV